MTNTNATFVEESLFVGRIATEVQAFIALYYHYFPRVYNYIRYHCDDPVAADDLTAMVFERALNKINGYDSQRGSFGGWLFAIARNLVNQHLRAQKRNLFLSLDILHNFPTDHPSPEEALIHAQTQNELLAAIRRIPERERDLLSLKFAARLTNRRIAEITGLTESNVGVILHRAVEKLRISLNIKEDWINE